MPLCFILLLLEYFSHFLFDWCAGTHTNAVDTDNDTGVETVTTENLNMAGNCYMSVLTQKVTAVGYCVQQAIQHVVHAPRSAGADEWCTALISLGLAIAGALLILFIFLVVETAKHRSTRRFT
jgi:hypothetical protein